MMNLDEYRRLHPKRSAADELAQVVAREAVGAQAQIVVDHPSWQLFLDHLQAIVNDLTRKADAKKAEMITGHAVGEALTVLKMEILAIEAERRGLITAMEVIPELIRRGHKEIDRLTKQDSMA